MELFKKIKNKMGMVAVFALLFQVTMPAYQIYVYAEENGMGTEALANSTELVEGEDPVGEDPVGEEPVVEEPVAEEPIGEDPAAEEPVVEEPVAEEPVAEEPVAEEPAAEEPVAEEHTGEEPAAEESETPEEPTEGTEDAVEPEIQLSLLNLMPQSIENYFATGENSNILQTGILSFRNETTGPTTTPTLSSIARIDFTWEIPEVIAEQVQDGDFFEFQLPAALKIVVPFTGDLADANGTIYGEFTTSTSGLVVMTFNNEVRDVISGVKGDLWFESKLDETVINEAGTVEIVLPVLEQETVEIFIKTNFEVAIEKQGFLDKTLNPTGVKWTVDFNKALDTLTNATITDTFPTGNEYVSVKVYKLAVDLTGAVVSATEITSGFNVDANGNVTFPGIITDAYRLVYETSILDSLKEDEGNSINLTNKAVLTSDEITEGLLAEATVRATFGKIIDKRRSGYNRAKQEFSWTVRYNYGEKTIDQLNAKLIDVMDNRLEIIEDSIVIKKVAPVTGTSETTLATLVKDTDYTVTATAEGFEVQFLDTVDYAIKMTYRTRVKEGIIIDDSTAARITNSISTQGEFSDGSFDDLEQRGVIKTSAGINYSTRRITWRITINENRYEMNNATLNDVFTSRGLVFDANAFEIEDRTNDTILALDTDYTVTPKVNDEGFDVTFIGSYATQMDSTLRITYSTPYVYNDLNEGATRFKNTATLTWKDNNNNEYINSDDATIRIRDTIKNNGFKNGSYNPVSKVITWKVGVNYNAEEIQAGAQISDPITGNQVYIPGSAKLYEYTIASNGSIQKGAEVTPGSLTEPTANLNTLSVTLPADAVGTTKGYLLEFETSLDGQIVENETSYTNIATFINGENPERELIGTVSMKFDAEFTNKSGFQRDSDGRFIDWSVAVNRSQSEVEDAKIVDRPSTNQIFIVDSLEIYPLTVQADGEFVKETTPLIEGTDYTVNVTTDGLTGQQEITVEFTNTIDQAYEINYSTMLSLSPGDKSVKNELIFSGKNRKVVTTSEESIVEVESSSGGGSASGEKGSITFKKTGADGQIMPGVQFELWDAEKIMVIRTGTVNENGLLTFGNLIAQDYYLREVSTLDGYTVSDELIEGKRVTVTVDTSETTEDIDYEIENQLSKVIIEKFDDGENFLLGAVFKLSDRIEGERYFEMEGYQAIQTDENGRIVLEGLLPGEYRLEEIQAPEGYVLNTTPIDFEVIRNGIQVPTIAVEVVNYQGSAELIKTDQEGNRLAGAFFSLLNEEGGVILGELFSDENGVVRVFDLAPGDYSFQEMSAPDGFILNDKKFAFTIADEATGKPEVVSVGTMINYQGSVELTKSTDRGTLLSGAVFELTGDEGTDYEATEFTTIDGKITVNNLRPGNYEFREVRAPSGFVLNTKVLRFEIKDVATDQPALVELSMTNYKGAARLQKTDEAGKGLAGAEFSILDGQGNTVRSNLVSGENGIVRVTNLSPGAYSFKETKAPDGYILNTKLLSFSITDRAQDRPAQINVGELVNYKGSAQLVKTDQEGNGLEGAEFSILDSEGEVVQSGLVSDENGLVEAMNLAPGAYIFKETKAPTGYILNTTELDFTVVAEAEEQPALINVGELINYQGTAQLIKVDSEDNKLEGAEFSILDSEGEVVQSGLVSDENGFVTAINLAPGEYSFIETKAPDGYILNTTMVDFTVAAEAEEQPVIVNVGELVNYQGIVIVTKVNFEDTNERLAGAEFELRDQDGNILRSGLITDEDGQINLGSLAPGDYSLVETRAPRGYERSNERLEFTIVSKNEGQPAAVELQISNKKVGVLAALLPDTGGTEKEQPKDKLEQERERLGEFGLPQTGEASNLPLYLIGSLLILAGLVIGKRRKVE